MIFTQDQTHPIITEFPAYLDEWRMLEEAYYRIPSWRWLKQLQNIRQRERLTKEYERKMHTWGLV